jgi:hypothetical protein
MGAGMNSTARGRIGCDGLSQNLGEDRVGTKTPGVFNATSSSGRYQHKF